MNVAIAIVHLQVGPPKEEVRKAGQTIETDTGDIGPVRELSDVIDSVSFEIEIY